MYMRFKHHEFSSDSTIMGHNRKQYYTVVSSLHSNVNDMEMDTSHTLKDRKKLDSNLEREVKKMKGIRLF